MEKKNNIEQLNMIKNKIKRNIHNTHKQVLHKIDYK